MIKLNSLEEMMQEHCSRIYWGIDHIEENIMSIVGKISEQEMSAETEKESRAMLSDYFEVLTFLRSEALELGEKFALFILDPGKERLNLKEQNTEDIMSVIAYILNEQTLKFHNFLQIFEGKEKPEEINGEAKALFFESEGSILREKGEIMNSLNFLSQNNKRYQYEINSKNSKSN